MHVRGVYYTVRFSRQSLSLRYHVSFRVPYSHIAAARSDDFDNAAKSTRLFSLVDFFIPLIFLTSSVFCCMVLFLLLFQSKRTKLGSLVDFSIRFIDDIIGVTILVDAVVFENDF